MKRTTKGVVAVGLAAALSLGACKENEPGYGWPLDANQGPGVAGEQYPVDDEPPRPVIEVGRLAAQKVLPPKVRAEVDSVVAITIYGRNGKKDVGSFLSGVAIDGGYLTSAHATLDEHGRPEFTCKDPTITRLRSTGKVATTEVTRMSATLYGESVDASSRDLSLMKGANSAPSAITTTYDKKAVDMEPGDIVYFVNYEPTINDMSRLPDSENQKLRTPAIYAGMVLQDEVGNDSQIAILTGAGRSFGAVPDNSTRHGASGGAIFDSNGRLKALTTSSAEDVTPDHIESAFGVDVKDPTGRDDFQVTYVQPVDQTLVSEMGRELTPVVNC